MPSSEAITVVITVNATAVPAPFSFSIAKAQTLLGFPPGTKLSVGSNIKQIPVKALSKASIGIVQDCHISLEAVQHQKMIKVPVDDTGKCAVGF